MPKSGNRRRKNRKHKKRQQGTFVIVCTGLRQFVDIEACPDKGEATTKQEHDVAENGPKERKGGAPTAMEPEKEKTLTEEGVEGSNDEAPTAMKPEKEQREGMEESKDEAPAATESEKKQGAEERKQAAKKPKVNQGPTVEIETALSSGSDVRTQLFVVKKATLGMQFLCRFPESKEVCLKFPLSDKCTFLFSEDGVTLIPSVTPCGAWMDSSVLSAVADHLDVRGVSWMMLMYPQMLAARFRVVLDVINREESTLIRHNFLGYPMLAMLHSFNQPSQRGVFPSPVQHQSMLDSLAKRLDSERFPPGAFPNFFKLYGGAFMPLYEKLPGLVPLCLLKMAAIDLPFALSVLPVAFELDWVCASLLTSVESKQIGADDVVCPLCDVVTREMQSGHLTPNTAARALPLFCNLFEHITAAGIPLDSDPTFLVDSLCHWFAHSLAFKALLLAIQLYKLSGEFSKEFPLWKKIHASGTQVDAWTRLQLFAAWEWSLKQFMDGETWEYLRESQIDPLWSRFRRDAAQAIDRIPSQGLLRDWPMMAIPLGQWACVEGSKRLWIERTADLIGRRLKNSDGFSLQTVFATPFPEPTHSMLLESLCVALETCKHFVDAEWINAMQLFKACPHLSSVPAISRLIEAKVGMMYMSMERLATRNFTLDNLEGFFGQHEAQIHRALTLRGELLPLFEEVGSVQCLRPSLNDKLLPGDVPKLLKRAKSEAKEAQMMIGIYTHMMSFLTPKLSAGLRKTLTDMLKRLQKEAILKDYYGGKAKASMAFWEYPVLLDLLPFFHYAASSSTLSKLLSQAGKKTISTAADITAVCADIRLKCGERVGAIQGMSLVGEDILAHLASQDVFADLRLIHAIHRMCLPNIAALIESLRDGVTPQLPPLPDGLSVIAENIHRLGLLRPNCDNIIILCQTATLFEKRRAVMASVERQEDDWGSKIITLCRACSRAEATTLQRLCQLLAGVCSTEEHSNQFWEIVDVAKKQKHCFQHLSRSGSLLEFLADNKFFPQQVVEGEASADIRFQQYAELTASNAEEEHLYLAVEDLRRARGFFVDLMDSLFDHSSPLLAVKFAAGFHNCTPQTSVHLQSALESLPILKDVKSAVEESVSSKATRQLHLILANGSVVIDHSLDGGFKVSVPMEEDSDEATAVLRRKSEDFSSHSLETLVAQLSLASDTSSDEDDGVLALQLKQFEEIVGHSSTCGKLALRLRSLGLSLKQADWLTTQCACNDVDRLREMKTALLHAVDALERLFGRLQAVDYHVAVFRAGMLLKEVLKRSSAKEMLRSELTAAANAPASSEVVPSQAKRPSKGGKRKWVKKQDSAYGKRDGISGCCAVGGGSCRPGAGHCKRLPIRRCSGSP